MLQLGPRVRGSVTRSRAMMFAVAVFVTLSMLPTQGAEATTPRGRNGIPAFSHVFVVMMENTSYATALADPGISTLVSKWAMATNYYGITHPSLPNYIALTSGGTYGITDDCVTCYVSGNNLLTQLASAKISYNAYFEGVPGPCFLSPFGGTNYAAKHNPFRYFMNIRSSPSLCSHLRPLSDLMAALSGPASSLPRFIWVTPNMCNDGHDCATSTASAWLNGFVARVTGSAAWRNGGALFVTWDEGDGSDTSGVGVNGRVDSAGGGGHVLTLVIDKSLRQKARISIPLNHYSLLATIEDAFKLPRLGLAKRAANFAPLFRSLTK